MSKTALQDVMSIADSLGTQISQPIDNEDLKVDPFFIEDPMASSMVERAIKSANICHASLRSARLLAIIPPTTSTIIIDKVNIIAICKFLCSADFVSL